MSTPRLISPLLDNFLMGEPIYDKCGIRLCPAMEEGKDNKYIVKIISIPANQSQVDALLITGAYKDADSVNRYFAELADAIVKEADVLTQFSGSGGFDAYKGVQIVPMDDGNGFDVYLLAPYRPTWDRLYRQKPVSQLDGYNLALDLCAALSVARSNGYLYVNLRPESISATPSGYHISDLGFMGLNFLQYSSLPTAYFSPYTAPEVADAFSSLNATMDVYALGMLLYEIFNCGLPFIGDRACAEEYPAPAYAEEEFAGIIQKAIHPDPASRWQDPTQMGQAIVSVMQRKGVSDALILPVVETPEEEPPAAEEDVLALADEFLEQASADETEVAAVINEDVAEPIEEIPEEPAAEEPAVPEAEVIAPVTEEIDAPSDAQSVCETENAAVAAEAPVEVSNESVPEEPEITDIPEVPADLQEDAPCDTIPAVPVEDIPAEDAVPADTDSIDDILLEADRLIADIEADPAPTATPEEYVQLQIEEPAEEQPTPIETAPEAEAAEPAEDENKEEPVIAPAPPAQEEDAPKTSKKAKSALSIIAIIAAALLLVLLLTGGLFIYRHVYIQEIDGLYVSGTADAISVSVLTDVDSSKLTVVCTDANGNTVEAELVDYKATFAGLSAQSDYTVSLRISGLHKLIGETEYTYTTAEKTVITDLQVLNGTVEGAAEVTYQLEGPNEGEWFVTFKAQGENDLMVALQDGKTTVVGLTSGVTYNVTLSNTGSLYLDGTLETTFTPGPVIEAKDLCVTVCVTGMLRVQWSSDAETSWIVRCYNESGFDQSVTVSQTSAEFAITDAAAAYTVEISAVGQATVKTLQVTENAVNLSDFKIDTATPGVITMSWNADSEIPAGGYIVTYTVGSFTATMQVEGNALTLNAAAPNSTYTFTFEGVNGQSVLCEPVSVTTPKAAAYDGHGITSNNLRYSLCLRPNKSNWTQSDVSSAYTTTFSAGQNASIVGRIITRYFTSDKMITTLYVFRDSNGQVAHLCSVDESWGYMWYNGYGYFDIPSLPSAVGSYTMEIYYNGALAHSTQIIIK